MRIIAGEYASRHLETLKGDATRPTLDKVKEAIFSSLGTYFEGGSILDLYAGSGVIGLEAISRGMDSAFFCDTNPKAIEVIKKNINALGVKDACVVWKIDALKALKKLQEQQKQFDLIYLDPPYAKQTNQEVLNRIEEYGLLKEHGRIVIEAEKEDERPLDTDTIHFQKEVIYGMSIIRYYRKEEN